MMFISQNDRARMLRPAIYQLDKEKAEFFRWFDENHAARPAPLDAEDLIRFFVKNGMPIKEARSKVAAESLAAKGDKALWVAVQNPMIERLISEMKAEIEKHGLEVLQRYPNDLLVHDRNVLLSNAAVGSQFGWTVSDCNTRLVVLGLHKEMNQEVTYGTNDSSNQRFYSIKVRSTGFELKELTREGFISLQNTPIPYKKSGLKGDFRVLRGDVLIGHVSLVDTGNWHNKRYTVTVEPVANISALDSAALSAYANRAAIDVAGTLFVRTNTVWNDTEAACIKAA